MFIVEILENIVREKINKKEKFIYNFIIWDNCS